MKNILKCKFFLSIYEYNFKKWLKVILNQQRIHVINKNNFLVWKALLFIQKLIERNIFFLKKRAIESSKEYKRVLF